VSWFSPGWQQRTTWPCYCPSAPWGEEENWKKKAKLVDQDKDSLTEQQRNQSVITIILITRIYKTREYTGQVSHHPMPSTLPRND